MRKLMLFALIYSFAAYAGERQFVLTFMGTDPTESVVYAETVVNFSDANKGTVPGKQVVPKVLFR